MGSAGDRMRIALITPGFSASEEDWCIPVLLNLVRSLSRQVDVQVFTLRYPHHRRTYQVGGATVHAFGGAETRSIGRFHLLQRALRRVLELHRSEPFDVIHGFWADEPGALAATAGRITGVPSLVSIMGGELVSFPAIGYGGRLGIVNSKLIDLSLRLATAVTTGSPYLGEIARRQVDARKLHSLPLGVDTGLFRPDPPGGPAGPIMSGSPAVISVGSLAPVKGQRVLLDAIAKLAGSFPDIHLHLVGDGPLRDELQNRAQALGIEESITLHGEVRHDDLPCYYRSADLFVSSSLHESQGMAALEAAACGCPVVGSAVGILPEISPLSRAVRPGNADALAGALEALCTGHEGRQALRDSVRRKVESEFTLELTVDRLVGLYRDLAGTS